MSGDVWGDIPTWITTVAVIIAAVQYLGERTRRRAESEREARAQATKLTAWAVTNVVGGRRYGICLSNTSGSTFHDVEIEAIIHGEKPRRPIVLAIVPPGDYFVPFNGNDQEYTWDFARAIDEEPLSLRPYMKTDKYRVDAVRFRDNLGQQWTTNDRAVLRGGN